jgi:hypothetical protein
MQPNAESASGVAGQVAAALDQGAFDPQHAGELFLRVDAEKAIRAALSAPARIAVAGRDESQVRATSFMGARFAPDLIVEAGGGPVAVTITLLRGDASPITQALAGALVLSSRFAAVVAFILDRRLAKRNPFDDPTDTPEQRALSDAERTLIERLWERHRIRVVVRRQDPFGW